jgi:D-alanyl-lipoteichoic acid acyltransferase DltB (MBOAT superfamily)
VIADPGGIGADSLGFLAMAAALILVAWSPLKSWFPWALAIASTVFLLSWLTPLSILALALFIAPPYFVTSSRWGRGGSNGSVLVFAALAWQVAFFIVLRKYQWVEGVAWLDHPIAIIGISYILFRTIHLMVEAPYLGDLPFGPGRYLTYVLAFWTLLSGPIQRYEAFCDGLATIGRPPAADARAAGHRAVDGLIKAFLIAPIFLPTSDIRVLDAPTTGWLDVAIAFYSFPIYLYFNFSGYTDLVIAVTRLCGMGTMPENFDRPYLARNVQDFWARWHISFSTWIRQYLFTPLSKILIGAATARALQSPMMALSIILTFLIVGAWHGTTSNFLVFGLLHGGALVLGAFWGGALKRLIGNQRRRSFERHPLTTLAARILCVNYVCFTLHFINNPAGDVMAQIYRLVA